MSTILAPAAFHHSQSTGLLDYVLHVVIASGIWSFVRSLPAPLQLLAVALACLLVVVRRRRRARQYV